MTTPMGHIDSCQCPDCASRAAQMSPAALMGVDEAKPQAQSLPSRRGRAVVQDAMSRMRAVNAAMSPQPGGPEVGDAKAANDQLLQIQRDAAEQMLGQIFQYVKDHTRRLVQDLPSDQLEDLMLIMRALVDRLHLK